MKTLLFAILAVLLAAGCSNPTATNAARTANRQAEAAGSPFRWKAQSLGGGATAMYLEMLPLPLGTTKADDTLKKDVLSLIADAEVKKGRPAPLLAEVRLMPDGREVWDFSTSRGGLAYVVGFDPGSQGGTRIRLSGPFEYRKEK